MISVLCPSEEVRQEIIEYFLYNNLENYVVSDEDIRPINEYLRLDYSVDKYKFEAIESTPKHLHLLEKKIYENNPILATDDIVHSSVHARTVTTKQDRHPNSGIIEYSNIQLTSANHKYRNLTPRECFFWMGFEEEDFDRLQENNINITEYRKILPTSKLIKLAGNSIVVQVLEKVFIQIDEINNQILTKQSTLSQAKNF